MTSQLNVALFRKLGVAHVLGLCFDILSKGVRTTRHLQTSGRLLQELSVCTVQIASILQRKEIHDTGRASYR